VSNRSRLVARLAWVGQALLFAICFLTCKREARPFRDGAMRGSAVAPYDDNAWGMSEGQRLYAQMNCMGCHAHGGGGMGPALMDGAWRYGASDTAIFDSIVSGRPNGMPAFRNRLGDDQIWQLVAYVKSIGGRAAKAAAAARDDHMAVAPGPASIDPKPIVEERTP
jgi:mono/diheme cytochrome c family protein